jgi:hypothetical protein
MYRIKYILYVHEVNVDYKAIFLLHLLEEKNTVSKLNV